VLDDDDDNDTAMAHHEKGSMLNLLLVGTKQSKQSFVAESSLNYLNLPLVSSSSFLQSAAACFCQIFLVIVQLALHRI
jgi:hypothetical protein